MFSQNSYPRKLIIEDDTVIVITPVQRDLIVNVFTDRDEFGELVLLQDTIISKLAQTIDTRDSLISFTRFEIAEYKEVIDNYEEINLHLQKDLRKTRRNLKLLKFASGTTVTIGIVAIVYLAVK